MRLRMTPELDFSHRLTQIYTTDFNNSEGSKSCRTTPETTGKEFFFTMQATKVNTMITICSWESYQANTEAVNQHVNHPLTNGSPSVNQHLTTNKNVKKEKNVKTHRRDDFEFSAGVRELRRGGILPEHAAPAGA